MNDEGLDKENVKTSLTLKCLSDHPVKEQNKYK